MSEQPRGAIRTAVDAAEPHLRGRTYAIPFERVWQTALELARTQLKGWTVEGADDYEGIIRTRARSTVGGEHEIDIHVSLDDDAQTRVDLEVRPLKVADFGRATRRIQAFFRALDNAILPAAARPSARRR
jgi:hypothetical protein